MVGAAIRDRTEFGVVLAKDDGVVNTGCTVAVQEKLHEYPDGRMDILTRGGTRFEITAIHEDKSWLEAEVEYFDDEEAEPAPEEMRLRAVGLFEALRAIASPEGRGEPDLSDRQLSFQIAQFLPDLDFLDVLLRLRSETARLKELNRFLAGYIPRQRSIERMKGLASTNGHGGAREGL